MASRFLVATMAAAMWLRPLVVCAQMPPPDQVVQRRGEWIQRQIAHPPPAVIAGAMVYDTVRRRIVLFGGHSGDSLVAPGSVWEYDGLDWVQAWDGSQNDGLVGPIWGGAPKAIFTGSLCIVHCGNTHFSDPSYDHANSDELWSWNGTNWVSFGEGGEVPPSVTGQWPQRRKLAGMCYDPIRGRTLLVGGISEVPPSGGLVDRHHDDTWEFGCGLGWCILSDALPMNRNTCHSSLPHGPTFDTRVQAVTAFDPRRQVPVLVAGCGNFALCDNQQTLEFSSANVWTDVGGTWPSQTGPACTFPIGAVSTTRGVIVLLDGFETSCTSGLRPQTPDCLTWERDCGVWRLADTVGPRARIGAAMAYDSDRRTMVMFGGYASDGTGEALNETWEMPDDLDDDGIWNHWERQPQDGNRKMA